ERIPRTFRNPLLEATDFSSIAFSPRRFGSRKSGQNSPQSRIRCHHVRPSQKDKRSYPSSAYLFSVPPPCRFLRRAHDEDCLGRGSAGGCSSRIDTGSASYS